MALVKSSSSHSDCKTGNLKSLSINSKRKEGEQNPVCEMKKYKLSSKRSVNSNEKGREQNLVGSGESLERQGVSGGHRKMVSKGSSISHSGCGTRNYKQGCNLQSKMQKVSGEMQYGILKSSSSVNSNEKGREQRLLSLSPSLSLSLSL